MLKLFLFILSISVGTAIGFAVDSPVMGAVIGFIVGLIVVFPRSIGDGIEGIADICD